jgi:hypothetical protein
MPTILFVSHFTWTIDINKHDSVMSTNCLYDIYDIPTGIVRVLNNLWTTTLILYYLLWKRAKTPKI